VIRALFLAALVLLASGPARAQALIADLSSHLIAITTGFAGTELLLFGATEGEGDVVVIVRGPDGETSVRRKARVAGIWINRDELRFSGVPTFYRIASSKPLADFVPLALRQRHQIGVDFLRLVPQREVGSEEAAAFRAGMVRNKEAQKLYEPEVGRVSFLGARLFRTRIVFPANVPTGNYSVEVLLIRGGQVIAAQTTPMFVSKVGFGADIYDFAHEWAALYGLIAILLAVSAGWAAGLIFRK
jgi:uncharacterized protein (TIGR02186 family)